MTHSIFDLGSVRVLFDALFIVFILINHRSSNTCQGVLRCVVYCLISINHKNGKSTDRINALSDSFALVSRKDSFVIPSVILSKKGICNGIN